MLIIEAFKESFEIVKEFVLEVGSKYWKVVEEMNRSHQSPSPSGQDRMVSPASSSGTGLSMGLYAANTAAQAERRMAVQMRDRDSHIAKELRALWVDKNPDFPVFIEVSKSATDLKTYVQLRMECKDHAASVKIEEEEIDWTGITPVLKEMKKKLIATTPSGLEVEGEDKEASTEGSGD